MRSHRLSLLLSALLIAVLIPISPPSSAHISDDAAHDHVVISEILVSPDDAEHNGTDWNGDGWIDAGSDQFIELWNPTDQEVNIGGWWLDDDIDPFRCCSFLDKYLARSLLSAVCLIVSFE